MISMAHRWILSAAAASAALVLFSPPAFLAVEYLAMRKGLISTEDGRRPTYLGLILHTIVLFFAIYCILLVDWDCV